MRVTWRNLACCAALLPALGASQQAGTYPTLPINAPSTSGSRAGGAGIGQTADPGFAEFDPNLSHRQLVARREEARRRMLLNAERLLALTRTLQESLRQREATGVEAKNLDDIAKLARAVRDQMRQ